MMLDRERFLAAGSLRGRFVCGRTERRRGFCGATEKRRWTDLSAPAARLYHLEGQSRPQRLRELATPYDTWLFKEEHRSRR
jgi:hypothetical protein